MRLTDVAVISKRVVVALSKPSLAQLPVGAGARDSTERALNVTLYVDGTDADRPASWSVVNGSLVPQRLADRDGASWLRLPPDDMGVDAVRAGRTEVVVPL
eukprot:888671-Prymnesium_polylepis.1